MRGWRNSAIVVFTGMMVVVSVWVAGCSTAPRTAETPDIELTAGCIVNGRWVKPRSPGSSTTAQVAPALSAQEVVLLGEFHDNSDHHLWQLQTISALYGHKSEIAIGLEMLPRSAQPVLDRWVGGELSESEFLAQSQWREYWQFDPQLYLPILRFARLNQIPLYGLNVEKSLLKRVRLEGWGQIPEAERDGITDPAPAQDAYLQMLAETFQFHGHGTDPASMSPTAPSEAIDLEKSMKNPAFVRFVEGQQLWDRGMAQAIADALADQPGRTLVALMGSGHLMDGFGVPHQLADLGVTGVMSALPWDDDLGCEMVTAKLADYVFGLPTSAQEVQARAEEDKPKLGVRIENTEGGVRVVSVVEGSVAEQAGVAVNDLIVEIAGRKVWDVQEVIDTVQQTLPGTWLPLSVSRNGGVVELLAKFATPN